MTECSIAVLLSLFLGTNQWQQYAVCVLLLMAAQANNSSTTQMLALVLYLCASV